jgi:MFS superfamily sulfate permease-like transporter
MFLLFLRYRRSLGVQTTDAQMILAALWIGASFGFYEWSVKELASYLLFVSNISHAIKTALVLAYRMAAHGGFTVWMGITYWFGRNTSRPKFAVLFGLVFAVLFHMLHNYFSYYPDLRLISVLLALVGCINIGVVVKWYLQKKDRLRNCNEKLRHSHAFEGKRT